MPDELIRASSLPTWSDCPRRWAATQRKRLLAAAGYDLAQRPPSVGAHVGTASHAGVARGWQGIQESGLWTPDDECDDTAVEALRAAEERDGVSWDRTTPDRDAAQSAARKIIRAYKADIPRERQPALIEAAMRARIKPGWVLEGHCDLFTEPDQALEDLKTGVRVPAPLAQLGGYNLLIVANGRRVDRNRMTWVRRVGKKTEQPPPMTVAYDVSLATRTARSVLVDITTTTDRFLRDGDPFHYRANLGSVLCGPKYCPAFHTRFCPESLSKQGNDDV